MIQNYKGKIEVKPDRFAYIQTQKYKDKAQQYINDINWRWSPPRRFYHLDRKGGHVAAINSHLHNTFFAKIDLSNFFGQITKSKIINSLTKLKFRYSDARDIAIESTVYCKNFQRFHLPYGFIQSPLLSSLVLAKSNFYRQLKSSAKAGIEISLYVDDIVLSSRDEQLLKDHYSLAIKAAAEANFDVNFKKSHTAQTSLSVFNINLLNGKLKISDDRQNQFEQSVLLTSNKHRQKGIINYVGTVNKPQANALHKLASGPLANTLP